MWTQKHFIPSLQTLWWPLWWWQMQVRNDVSSLHFDTQIDHGNAFRTGVHLKRHYDATPTFVFITEYNTVSKPYLCSNIKESYCNNHDTTNIDTRPCRYLSSSWNGPKFLTWCMWYGLGSHKVRKWVKGQ